MSASVAQLVEQGIENSRVVGSIPTGGIQRFSADIQFEMAPEPEASEGEMVTTSVRSTGGIQ